jgi:2-phospho-L-lactate guanylyltransferase
MCVEVRSSLGIAFATDTLRAVAQCDLVRDLAVVSPDAAIAEIADEVGATFVQSATGATLNAVVDEAFRQTRDPWDQMVAALVSDLPALRTDELEDVMLAAGRRNSTMYVTDLGHRKVTMQVERASTFTCCLAADSTRRQTPPGTPVHPLLPGLRGDVDTYAGLRIAEHMGVATASRKALADLDGMHVPRGGVL